MTSYKSMRSVCAALIFAYVALSCAAFYLGDLLFRSLAVIVGCVVFILMIWWAPKRNIIVLSSFWTVICLVAAINMVWSDHRSLFLVLIFFSCLGVSWAAFEFQLTKYLYEYVFIMFLALTFFLVFLFGYGYKEFNVFLEGSSRNVYSALMLASAVGYVLSVIYRGEKPALFLIVLFVMLSYPLYGRSAIFFSVVLLFSVLFFYYRKTLFFCLFCFVLFLVFSYIYFDGQIDGYARGTNFEAGLESERFDMLADYFKGLDVNGVFFGGDFTVYPSIEARGGNPHNAFLRLHGYWGVGISILLFLFFVSQILAVQDKRAMIAFIAFLILARSFFDIVYLFNLFDYLFFPAILYFFYRPYYVGNADVSRIGVGRDSNFSWGKQ